MRAGLERLIEQGAESPFYKLLDMKIEEVQNDYARLSIEICEKHLQFLKTVHGGVIAALADSAAAWAAISVSNPNSIAVTVEMKINFLRPVSSGKLTAEARNIHKGSKIFVSDVDVKNGVGELVAKALITYYLVQTTREKG
ncbi:MAG: PaaI family thioesterase [Candidatus Bathyarchaeia archaeon]